MSIPSAPLLYRLAQRLIVLELTRVLSAPTDTLAAGAPTPESVGPLDRESLERFAAAGDAPWCEALVPRLGVDPDLHAYGAVVDGRLASFAWANLREAEPAMNVGYCAGTAQGMRLADDAAFLFHAFTQPAHRGQGWMVRVIRYAAEDLSRRGVRWVVTTTDHFNRPARAALASAGFGGRGWYLRVGPASCCATRLGGRPTPPVHAYT